MTFKILPIPFCVPINHKEEMDDKLEFVLALSRKPRNTEQLQNKDEPNEARKQKWTDKKETEHQRQ